MKKVFAKRRVAGKEGQGRNGLAEALLNAASDHALLMEADGRVLAVNSSMAKLFNLTPGELVGEIIYDFFPFQVVGNWSESVRRCAEEGRPLHFEDAYFQGRDIEVSVVPTPGEDGSPGRVAVFCRDITERKAAERERMRLAAALEQAADGVILYDKDMRVEYINQSFEALTGYSLHDVRGFKASAFCVGPEQHGRFVEIVETLARGDAWTGKACNTCKNGAVICCHKTVSPIRGKGGLILGYVSLWRDVTAVENLERQLREAQKMETIGTLVGGIAHDFNNILSPIVLLADIGLFQMPEDSPHRSTLERILQAAQRASALVRQILSLSRRHEKDLPSVVHVGPIMRECLDLLRPGLPSTIDIRLEMSTAGDVIMADPAQVHQCIMNLCTNAAWAMRGSGGVLGLGLSGFEVRAKGDPAFPAAEPGAYVLVQVRDTGHGIQPEHMERIFDPFFTTRSDGTGLGLAVVRNIVNRLRGSVRVESELGQGTCVSILLPCAATGEGDRDIADAGQVCVLAGNESVLVVDDEQCILDACALGLNALGYRVTTCSRGDEALRLFRENPERFDLVLSDVTMPGLTGSELAREILRQDPHLPIILSSGHSEVVDKDKAWRVGALDYLPKPYRMEDLAATVRRLLDRRTRRTPGKEA